MCAIDKNIARILREDCTRNERLSEMLSRNTTLTVEGNAGERQSKNHSRRGPHHDPPASNDIDVLQRKEREQEVSTRNDETDSSWLVEANRLEERRGIVHQRVEPAKLLEGLQSTRNNYTKSA